MAPSVVVIYSDASFKDGKSGLGVVVCRDGKIIVRSVSRTRIVSTLEAEARAAEHALTDAVIAAGKQGRVKLFVDNRTVWRFLNGQRIGEDTRLLSQCLKWPLETMADMRIQFECVKIRAHGGDDEDYADRDSYLNGVADCLAHVGRHGRTIDRWFNDDETLEDCLAQIDWRLDPTLPHFRRRTFSREEAAAEIGVSVDTVDRLVRHGHLSVDTVTARIPNSSVRAVASEYRLLGGRNGTETYPRNGEADESTPVLEIVKVKRRRLPMKPIAHSRFSR